MALIVFVIVVTMLVAAVAVLLMKNMVAALAAASVVSLAISLIFVLLRAPDVAMTEAAVGAGLSSLILALGLRRLGLWHLEGEGENLLAKHDQSVETASSSTGTTSTSPTSPTTPDNQRGNVS